MRGATVAQACIHRGKQCYREYTMGMCGYTVNMCGHSVGVTSFPVFHRGHVRIYRGQPRIHRGSASYRGSTVGGNFRVWSSEPPSLLESDPEISTRKESS
ncbi:hypothetical protein Y032_0035g3075 [Ancylostoma ceylanicum]|uniref:Uncharacterized protein n=1 Tax=Ancylostoma ceylanicum TaxID=53326 RepID=A0A016UNB4_9BILA|nr:hypothetical protein Y032_0035g3075 [Ancylostoma ceylanicum]